jgi:hypothetical protein
LQDVPSVAKRIFRASGAIDALRDAQQILQKLAEKPALRSGG